jgi:hypothetical protein
MGPAIVMGVSDDAVRSVKIEVGQGVPVTIDTQPGPSGSRLRFFVTPSLPSGRIVAYTALNQSGLPLVQSICNLDSSAGGFCM